MYANHAYIGADSISTHGMQVFDLTRLRGVTTPQTFAPDARYTGFGNSHTLSVNEATGFIFAVGTNTCSGGVHMVNVQSPKNPVGAGCVSSDGYVHENQCVIYHGPDTTYTGHEICFNYNTDTLTVVDVTDKAAPVQLSRTGYTGSAYTHQGWLTEDHARLTMNDELDSDSPGTRTFIWNVSNLDAPVNTGVYISPTSQATDHNHYIIGNTMYQSAYRAGLRILDISGIASNTLTEIGYFDIYPAANNTGFNGSWNNYPFFASGTLAISGIEQGLFLVKHNPGVQRPKFTNDADFPIADFATIESPITVSDVPGNALATAKVDVNITHTRKGDLVVTLVAPDGSTYTLHNRTGGNADNIIQTFTVDLAGEVANGTWKLRVYDARRNQTGALNTWSLTP